MNRRDRLYTTEDARPAERLDYWNDVICRTFVSATGQFEKAASFDAVLTARSIGPLQISEMRAPAHHWTRTPADLRKDPDDSFLVSMVAAGSGHIHQGPRELRQVSGDIVLYDTSRVFDYSIEPQSLLILKVPRGALLQKISDAERATILPLGRDLPLSGPLREAIGFAAGSAGNETDNVRSRLGDCLLDLLTLTIELQLEGGRHRDNHDRLRDKVRSYVDQRLHDTQMTPRSVARANNISERTLARIFAEVGTSPMRYIWQRRLEMSHEALMHGRCRSVTEAAFLFGFCDLAHFSRAYKNRYGAPPGRARRQDPGIRPEPPLSIAPHFDEQPPA